LTMESDWFKMLHKIPKKENLIFTEIGILCYTKFYKRKFCVTRIQKGNCIFQILYSKKEVIR